MQASETRTVRGKTIGEGENLMGSLIYIACVTILMNVSYVSAADAETRLEVLDRLVGQPADIASSAYRYRADRQPDQNPPEAWILLLQYANLPFDRPVDVSNPGIKKALCGLLWEEVRPVRRVELSWPADARNRPPPDELVVSYFDATDGTAHTWWNPRSIKEASRPEVSSDGHTYTYMIPVDTWGVVAAVRGGREASSWSQPAIRAIAPDLWKKVEIEIEWGFDSTTAVLDRDGSIQAYDGVVANVRPLPGDERTVMTGRNTWSSPGGAQARRGLRLFVLYMGSSRWRRVWPYHAQPDDVARTILTIRTGTGGFSFLTSDLEQGPILAPESGFFVRASGRPDAGSASVRTPSSVSSEPPFPLSSQARTAGEFLVELGAKKLSTIRQRTGRRAEQTWEGAVGALHGSGPHPPHPAPPLEPAMQVEAPCERLTAQWKLGAWHILRRSAKDQRGRWRFNDYPFGILASETYMILHALDLQGMHREAADGLDQWLVLPMEPKIVPGANGHHAWAIPDRPLGHFSDGRGCLTHAEGLPGAGGHMDGVHAMGPGAIMFALLEHYRLTGDLDWLRAHAPRMKANAEWILRQRRLLADIIPGGERLWSRGLQPAHVVTPDSERMHMQFYESEAYYWLAVKRLAEALAALDRAESARLEAEAESYRKDLVAAIDRSILLTPVVVVRDGTYRSFIPFAPYVRGCASGAWGWRRCQGHVGAIYWDTVQSADPLVSPAGLLSPHDPRVQGHLDVLEDRLLLENTKVHERTAGFDPQKHWFALASWQYQCGLERHANIHLEADDAPSFLRSFFNQYAVDIMPGEYTFREHTTGGPPDKIYEESCFLERFRNMLVMEEENSLWLARAAPRAWFEQGKQIVIKQAPTHFGPVSYRIVSDLDHEKITATIEMPARDPPGAVLLRLRHPRTKPITAVEVDGTPCNDFDKDKEVIRLKGRAGVVTIVARY
jgi:hypothetical protein